MGKFIDILYKRRVYELGEKRDIKRNGKKVGEERKVSKRPAVWVRVKNNKELTEEEKEKAVKRHLEKKKRKKRKQKIQKERPDWEKEAEERAEEKYKEKRHITENTQKAIKNAIKSDGLKYNKVNYKGRWLNIGIPKNATGVQDYYVYDIDGSIYTMEQFKQKIDDEIEHQKILKLIEKNPEKFQEYITHLQKMNEDEVDKLVEEQDGDLTFEYISDSELQYQSAVKMFKCVEVEKDGVKIIAEGAYKGLAIDDLISMSGKMIGGKVKQFNPRTGKLERIVQKRGRTRRTHYELNTEPYVIKKGNRCYMMLPDNRKYKDLPEDLQEKFGLNKLRKHLRELKKQGVVKQISKNRFEFLPMHIEKVQEGINSMTLSKAAAKMINDTIVAQNARAMQEETEKLQKKFGVDVLGGFKEEIEGRSYQLGAIDFICGTDKTRKTPKNRGFVALDTGLGKTLTGLMIIKQWLNTGKLKENGKNGKALIVVPAKLQGNFPEEIDQKMTEKGAKELKDNITVMSYNKFQTIMKGQDKELTPADLQQYGGFLFDEAHENMRNKTDSHRACEALGQNADRVFLSGSPMVKNPVENYNLVKLIEGDNLNVEAKDISNTTVKVDNKVIGIKDDPISKETLKKFIKTYTYFVDKEDPKVKQMTGLPDITPHYQNSQKMTLEGLTSLNPNYEAVIKEYRKYEKEYRKTLEVMSEKYRYGGKLSVEDLAAFQNTKKGGLPAVAVQKMARLLNDPNKYFRGELAKKLIEKNPEKYKEMGKAKVANLPEVRNKVKQMGIVSPKILQSQSYIEKQLNKPTGKKATVTFTDSPDLAVEATEEYAKMFPGKKHVVCLAGEIKVYQYNAKTKKAEVVKRWRDDPKDRQWSVKAIQSLKQGGENGDMFNDIATLNMTSAYQTGQNLQSFSNQVIHLDRDNWANENLKQRTARVYRGGQDEAVNNYFMDINSGGDLLTLNSIQRFSDDREGRIFEETIKAAMQFEINESSAKMSTSKERALERKTKKTKERMQINSIESQNKAVDFPVPKGKIKIPAEAA